MRNNRRMPCRNVFSCLATLFGGTRSSKLRLRITKLIPTFVPPTLVPMGEPMHHAAYSPATCFLDCWKCVRLVGDNCGDSCSGENLVSYLERISLKRCTPGHRMP